MKRALAAALGLILVAAMPPAWAQGQGALPVGTPALIKARPGAAINVRNAPLIALGNVVGQVTAGDPVLIEDASQQAGYVWYRVSTPGGLRGWVRGDLVAAGQAVPVPEPPAMAIEAPEPVAGPATPPPEPVASLPNDWTRFVPELLPAIDSCIGIMSLPPTIVTRVYEVQSDLAAVRMRDPTGRRWECVILRRGGYPIRYEPLADRGHEMPGDGNPIFIRAPDPPPQDDCHRNTELHDPKSGVLLGWRSEVLC